MALYSVVFDRPVPPVNGQPGQASLVALPFGPGTILSCLADDAAAAGCDGLFVLVGETSQNASSGGTAAMVLPVSRATSLTSALLNLEPSDWVLVVDPQYRMTRNVDLAAIVRDCNGYPGATHIMAIGADADRTTERVECDDSGCVNRIRRCYGGSTWMEGKSAVVSLSLVPVGAIADSRASTPAELRQELAARGVLSRDHPVDTDVLDLSKEGAILAFIEGDLIEAVRRPRMPAGYSRLSAGILVGRGALIHGTARVVPPVIIQAGARLEAGAVVIGPALIGADCTVGCNATVAQSVLPRGTCVPNGATVRHRLGIGGMPMSTRSETRSRLEGTAMEDAHRGPPYGLGGEPVLLGDHRDPRSVHRALKRAADVVLSIAGVVVCFPLCVAIAILIKLDSPGPVLFSHMREGRRGKVFPCLKFRTMHRHAHRKQRQLYGENMLDGPQFKMRNDPRVTRVGRFLRETNLDELPQLLNVLRGDLSLVGPRPSPFRENQICVPWRRARLSIRPGITGLWQLCRRETRSAGDFQEWIHYDMLYVRHMSLWLDLKILLATVTTLGGRWRVPLSLMIRAVGEEDRVAGWPQVTDRVSRGRRPNSIRTVIAGDVSRWSPGILPPGPVATTAGIVVPESRA